MVLVQLGICLSLAAIAFGQEQECCYAKTVGEYEYLFVGESDLAPAECLNNCSYIRYGEDDPNRTYCFAPGNLSAECGLLEAESELSHNYTRWLRCAACFVHNAKSCADCRHPCKKDLTTPPYNLTACETCLDEHCKVCYDICIGSSTDEEGVTTGEFEDINWSYPSCFRDFEGSNRVLQIKKPGGPSNTQESCKVACSGYNYAGVENGDECWCGNDAPLRAPINKAECDSPCPGDTREPCGDLMKILVMQLK